MKPVILLIADDEEDVRQAIIDLIPWEENGITLCPSASNGVEALERVETYHPDILLVDIRMPHKNGLDVIEELEGTEINAIVLSGYDDFIYAQCALKHGAKDYLLKPSLPEDILASVLKQRDLVHKRRNEKETIADVHSENKFVDMAIEYISRHFADEISLSDVAEHVAITPGYLSTLFRKHTEMSFVGYIHKVRIEKACELLKDVRLKNYEVAFAVGYKDEKYFTRLFKRLKGVTPSEYRQ